MMMEKTCHSYPNLIINPLPAPALISLGEASDAFGEGSKYDIYREGVGLDGCRKSCTAY